MRFLKQLSKKRQKRQKKRDSNPKLVLIRQIILGILILLLLAGIGTGVWYGSRIQSLTLTSVEVIGGETVAKDQVRELVAAELEGEYYRLVPKRFAWTYPKQAMLDAVYSLERVKNAYIERTSGTSLTVVFEEHIPTALWCENTEATECLFLDKNGYAFGTAPKLQGGAFVRFSETDVIPQKGTAAFAGDFIERATAFIELAYQQLNLNIIQVEKTSEDELVYHIAGGGTLKVSERFTTEETLENLTTILTSDAFSHIGPGNFQYIDLRYGNKVFVNEELESEVVASTTVSTSTEQ